MTILDNDIVRDILRRCVDAAVVDDRMALEIEREVRRDWGGDSPYIARKGSEEARQARNEKIYTLYWDQNIKDVAMLSTRFGLSMKQIRRIVGI